VLFLLRAWTLDYIIFSNVGNFKGIFLAINLAFFVKENRESFRIVRDLACWLTWNVQNI
jgi:hypothetical protein